jgi:hypothetical protein
MSRIISCARTGLAAGAVTLLMSNAASAAQINIHVPTPVIHVPTPVIHLPTPTVRVLVPSAHIKTPEINAGAGANHPVSGRLHDLGDQKRDFNSGNSGGNDVDGLVEGTLLAVSKDNQSALKSAAQQLRSNIGVFDASKSLSKQTNTGWSELAALLGKDRINSAFSFHPSRPTVYPGTGGAGFYSSFQMPTASGNGVTYYNVDLSSGTPLTSYFQLKGIQQDLQGDLDSMNEMSEMTSMRLQMAMDRRSAFVETLSNMLKKIDKSQEAIIQNMK